MCIGTPLEVLSVSGLMARCQGPSGLEDIDLSLIGPVAAGTFVLAHVGVGIRCIEAEEHIAIANAFEAVQRAARGEAFEHLLADLITRTPTLPDHLR
jgi:hydrogenase expression/formation protein HypC